MAAYTDKKTTKLKWFRFTQILIMPLSIILAGFLLYQIITTLIGLNQDNTLDALMQQSGTTISILSMVVVIAIVILFLVLDIFAWLGSFGWKKSSYHCWMLHLLLKLACVLFVFYEVFATSFIDGIVFDFAMTGQDINKLLIQILCGIGLAVFVFYYVVNIGYFFKRRKLYIKKVKDVVAPPVSQPVASTPVTDVGPTQVQEVHEEPVSQSEPIASQETEEEPKETEEPKSTEVLTEEPVIEKTDTETSFKQIYCPKCGAKIDREDAIFCNQCGAKLHE